jgi:hypothetical protein
MQVGVENSGREKIIIGVYTHEQVPIIKNLATAISDL